jgi:hypothetical protein
LRVLSELMPTIIRDFIFMLTGNLLVQHLDRILRLVSWLELVSMRWFWRLMMAFGCTSRRLGILCVRSKRDYDL